MRAVIGIIFFFGASVLYALDDCQPGPNLLQDSRWSLDSADAAPRHGLMGFTALAGSERRSGIWDANAKKMLRPVEGYRPVIRFSYDEKYYVAHSGMGGWKSLAIYSTSTGRLVRIFGGDDRSQVTAFALANNTNKIVFREIGRNETWTRLSIFDIEASEVVANRSDYGESFAFSPDDSKIYVSRREASNPSPPKVLLNLDAKTLQGKEISRKKYAEDGEYGPPALIGMIGEKILIGNVLPDSEPHFHGTSLINLADSTKPKTEGGTFGPSVKMILDAIPLYVSTSKVVTINSPYQKYQENQLRTWSIDGTELAPISLNGKGVIRVTSRSEPSFINFKGEVCKFFL